MTFVLAATLAVTLGAEPVKLASPGLSAHHLSEDDAQVYSDHLAQQLTLQGIRVITASDIAAVLGHERERQLLGCSDDSSLCIAELGDALGVDGLVTGTLSNVNGSYQVNVRILSTRDATPLSVYSGEAQGEKALRGELSVAAKLLAAQLKAKLAARQKGAPVQGVANTPQAPAVVAAPQAAERVPTAARRWAWVPLAASPLLFTGSLVFAFSSFGKEQALLGGQWNSPKPANLSLQGALDARDSGQREQVLATTLFFASVAAGVVGIAMYAQGDEPAPRVGATPVLGPGLYGASFEGVLW